MSKKFLRGMDDARNFCASHGIEYREEPLSDGSGTELKLTECPFNSNHDSGEAKLLVYSGGRIGFKCHHNSCADKDISDFIKHYEPDFYKDNGAAVSSGRSESPKDPPKNRAKKLSSVQSVPVEFLYRPYIPLGGITLISADGGTGKTGAESQIAASVSTGARPFICGNKTLAEKEDEAAGKYPSEGGRVLFLTGEESTSHNFGERLRSCGCNEDNIYIVDISNAEDLKKMTIGSTDFECTIEDIKPKLIIIDPLQSFLPGEVNMSARNQMRQALAPLAALIERLNCACVIAVHTNKRESVAGRNRVSDSSDIWDIARSVLMVGFTSENSKRYIAHEKSNWSERGRSILFTMGASGIPEFLDYSDKREADFLRENNDLRNNKKAAPKKEEAKDFILNLVKNAKGRRIDANSLKRACLDDGISRDAISRARNELKQEGKIEMQQQGRDGKGKGVDTYWAYVPED